MKILIVEDSESEAFLIETLFRSNDDFAGELLHVADVDDARCHDENSGFDIAFIDHFLGAETDMSLIHSAGGRQLP